jgi:hypothetical protein
MRAGVRQARRGHARVARSAAERVRCRDFHTVSTAGRGPFHRAVLGRAGAVLLLVETARRLRNLPLHEAVQNQVWLEMVQIAPDQPAWMPMLPLTRAARLWEPRRLRPQLFSAAAQLITTGRRRILHLAKHWSLGRRHHDRSRGTRRDSRATSPPACRNLPSERAERTVGKLTDSRATPDVRPLGHKPLQDKPWSAERVPPVGVIVFHFFCEDAEM